MIEELEKQIAAKTLENETLKSESASALSEYRDRYDLLQKEADEISKQYHERSLKVSIRLFLSIRLKIYWLSYCVRIAPEKRDRLAKKCTRILKN
jgi:hypothetical protein